MPHAGDFDIQYMRKFLRSAPATPTLPSMQLAAAATWFSLRTKKMAMKEALMRLGMHSCVVRFDGKEALYSNICAAFLDTSQQAASANQGDRSKYIPNRSVIVIGQAEPVGSFTTLKINIVLCVYTNRWLPPGTNLENLSLAIKLL